jgi:hypothetical protein
MENLMRVIATLLMLVAFPSFAGTVTASWANPTTYSDNSSLPVSAITRTRIEYGTCAGVNVFGTKLGEFVSLGNDTSEVSPNLQPGTYCFRALTTASGAESSVSSTDDAVILQVAPRPPVTFQVIVN